MPCNSCFHHGSITRVRPSISPPLPTPPRSVESAVDAATAAVDEVELKRLTLPDGASEDFTPNMLVKFTRVVDKAHAALVKAEQAVEAELSTRYLTETDPDRLNFVNGSPLSSPSKANTVSSTGGEPSAAGDGRNGPATEGPATDVVEEEEKTRVEGKGGSPKPQGPKARALATVDIHEMSGRSVWDAIRCGDAATLRSYLIAWGAVRVTKLHDKAPLEGSRTPLHTAAWAGHIEVLLILLAAGSDPNAIDLTSSRTTPLMEAARAGHADACGVLIVHGADVSRGDVQGSTALHWASRRDHSKAVAEIIASARDALVATAAQQREGRFPSSKRGSTTVGGRLSVSMSTTRTPSTASVNTSTWQQQQAAGGGAGAEASVGASVGASVPVVKPPMRRKDQEALLTLLCQKDARGRSAMDIAVSQETRGAFEVRPLWVCCGSVVQLEVEVSGE